MRATVNIEFGSEEIEGFATSVIVKSVAGSLGEIVDNPASLQVLLAGLQQGIATVLSHATMAHHHGPPRARPVGYPPPGPFGPTPQGYGPPPGANGPGDPGNVRPIHEPATVEHCFPIDETRQNEAGWGCCRCAILNGLSRTLCRQCGHQRCGGVVTPSPDRQPPQALPVEPETTP